MNATYRKLILTVLIVISVLLVSVPVYATPIGNFSEDDLVAQWEFDETSGSAVYDSLGQYNGTAKGTTIISGVEGKARRFNGTSDTITCSNPIIPAGNKTIKFNIRRSNIPQNFEWVFTTGLSQVAGEANCTAYIRPASDAYAGGLTLYICDKTGATSATVVVAKTENICDGEWHEVVVVFDNELGKALVYIDDLSGPAVTADYSEGKSDNINYSRNLKIGANYTSTGASNSYFAGDLDEFEIYNKCYIPAPQNITANPGNAQITLTWDTVEGVTGYNIKRATNPSGPYETVANAVYDATTYIDTTAINDTIYYYVMSAVNSDGESPNSTEVTAIPFSPVVAPSTPANLTATAGDTKVDLTWNVSDGTETYTVKRSVSAGGPYTAIGESLTATTFTDTNVTNGTKYYYIVTAINTAGESANSNEASATPTAGHTATGKIMIKTDDGLIYSGDLVEQTSEIFRLKNVYLFNGIPSFTSNSQATYNWEISFFKNKVIWFYFDK